MEPTSDDRPKKTKKKRERQDSFPLTAFAFFPSDEMIKERRKENVKASKKGPKKPSNTDRTIATGRAKREAAVKARRGLSESKKPNAMDVEREVYRQSRKTEASKRRAEKKASGGRLPPDASGRSEKKKKGKGGAEAPVAIFGGRTPSRKAVEAAIKGMEGAGFKVPQGHQVMMTFVPVATTQADDKDSKKKGGKKKGEKGQKK